jgi:hypothetical protein
LDYEMYKSTEMYNLTSHFFPFFKFFELPDTTTRSDH